MSYQLPRGTRRTFAFGRTASQLAVVASSLVSASLLSVKFGAVAFVIPAVGVPVALARWRGRPVIEVVPPVAAYVAQVATGQTDYVAPWPAPDAELVAHDDGPMVLDLPGALHGVTLRTVETRTLHLLRPDDPLCVIDQTGARTVTVVAEVFAPAFLLADDETQDDLTRGWSVVLDHAARSGSPISMLQVIDATVPGGREGGEAWHQRHGAVDTAAVADYAALRASIAAGQVHRSLVAVTVSDQRARSDRRASKGSTIDVLLAEASQLDSVLERAGVHVVGWLGPQAVAHLLRSAYDPASCRALGDVELSALNAGPIATRNRWGIFAHDSGVSCTLLAAAWPDQFNADVLRHLLLPGGVDRRVSLSFSPVDPARAARQVRARRNVGASVEASAQVRQASDARIDAAAKRADAELADGAGMYRYSLYVTVTAATPELLEENVAAMCAYALSARMELRRLYGVQDAAFAATLPLGRGIGRHLG